MAKIKYNAKVYEGTTAELASDETVYKPNDLIFDTELGVLKKGNGVDVYADLDTIGGGGGEGSTVSWEDITDKPTTFAPAAHAATLVNVAADATNGIAAGNAQVVLSALAARIKALEDAAG